MDGKRLCFIRYVGDCQEGFQYEFFFNEDIDEFWGEHFGEKPASTVNDLNPDQKFSECSERITLPMKLELITDSNCFSYQDSMDGIVCVGWCYHDGSFAGKFRYGERMDETYKTIRDLHGRRQTDLC